MEFCRIQSQKGKKISCETVQRDRETNFMNLEPPKSNAIKKNASKRGGSFRWFVGTKSTKRRINLIQVKVTTAVRVIERERERERKGG
jgi:hypothetical protein